MELSGIVLGITTVVMATAASPTETRIPVNLLTVSPLERSLDYLGHCKLLLPQPSHL